MQGGQIQHMVNNCINEEKENLPELTVEDWNEVYEEVQQ
jgi:hypothetical protein